MHTRSTALGITFVFGLSLAAGGCFLTRERTEGDAPQVNEPTGPTDEMRGPDRDEADDDTEDDTQEAPDADAPRTTASNPPLGPSSDDSPANPGSPSLLNDPVLIDAESGYQFMSRHQILGDMDGDGIDDFVLFAVNAAQSQFISPSLPTFAYLFYGRSDLPSRLSTADADAVLRDDSSGFAPGAPSRALGDVNADGLADLVIAGYTTLHFIFGTEERLSGDHSLTDAASITWSWALPGDASGPGSRQALSVSPAGEVDGDGISDFVVSLASTVRDDPSSATRPFFMTYLFNGHDGAWPSGDFDPGWATAELTVPGGAFGCAFMAGADLNGDGYSDLMVNAEHTMRFVSGGQALGGMVNAMDDGLPFIALYPQVSRLPDLDGDGSDELLWKDSPGLTGVYITYGGGELSWPLSLVPDAEIGAIDEAVGSVAAADVDGDGVNDLIFATGPVGSATTPPTGGIYAVPGDKARLSDKVDLGEPYLLIAGVNAQGEGLVRGSFGTSLDANGDVTGDGVADMLAGLHTTDEGPFGSTQVLLVPGGLKPTANNP